MVHEAYWEEISNTQLIYCANDNSFLDGLQDKINIDQIRYSNNDEPDNLGIRKINGIPCSSNYIGLCRLYDVTGHVMTSIDGREILLRIVPRFNVSVIDMLNVIRDDDEFERYLAPQTNRMDQGDLEIGDLSDNEVFTFFDKEQPIRISDSIAKSSSIIATTVFLFLLKELCRKPLMGRMQSKKENLVGKAKGKILFKQNIKYNTMCGRNDRLFCSYLKYSEDILENQVLKAALHKATVFVNKYYRSISTGQNPYHEAIAFCNKSLAHVSRVGISNHELNRVKVSGLYSYYKPVINAARMVLNELSLEANGSSRLTGFIIPYAVSMSKLFEMYVRACIKRSGIPSYKSASGDQVFLLQYDYKTRVLEHNSVGFARYISGNTKPDIIIRNPINSKQLVLDVKYKNLANNRGARNDRLQILAYALMYNCDNVGIVFPSLDGQNNYVYTENCILSDESRQRVYNQLELSIDTAWNPELKLKKNDETIQLYDYITTLLS